MPTDIKQIFREVLDKLEEEERNDLLLELKDKKLSGKELIEAIRDLPEDEKAAVRDAFIDVADRSGTGLNKEVKEMEKDAEKDEEAKGVEGEETEGEKKEEKKRKSRPGRKNGRAYGWYVDEKGRVKVSDVASVYSGDDEPDEVELYDQDDEEEEEEEI